MLHLAGSVDWRVQIDTGTGKAHEIFRAPDSVKKSLVK
jgi:hypothetical protein